MEFREWLLRQGHEDKKATMKKYAGAIYGRLSEMSGCRLYEIRDVDQFRAIADELMTDPIFKKLNSDGHHMYSCALNRYGEFLEDTQKVVDFKLSDILRIKDSKTLSETEKIRLISARLGQGQFRSELIRLWEGHCSVTGYSDCRLLIASHIKPWYKATNEERLDPKNGFLLTPTLDKAFDIGLITFNPRNQGRIVFSKSLLEPKTLGLSDTMFVQLKNEQTAKYLEYHRKQVFIP